MKKVFVILATIGVGFIFLGCSTNLGYDGYNSGYGGGYGNGGYYPPPKGGYPPGYYGGNGGYGKYPNQYPNQAYNPNNAQAIQQQKLNNEIQLKQQQNQYQIQQKQTEMEVQRQQAQFLANHKQQQADYLMRQQQAEIQVKQQQANYLMQKQKQEMEEKLRRQQMGLPPQWCTEFSTSDNDLMDYVTVQIIMFYQWLDRGFMILVLL